VSAFRDFNQGWIDFAKADFEKAIGSWNKAIAKNAFTWRWRLQPWIEKAKAKLPNNKP